MNHIKVDEQVICRLQKIARIDISRSQSERNALNKLMLSIFKLHLDFYNEIFVAFHESFCFFLSKDGIPSNFTLSSSFMPSGRSIFEQKKDSFSLLMKQKERSGGPKLILPNKFFLIPRPSSNFSCEAFSALQDWVQ